MAVKSSPSFNSKWRVKPIKSWQDPSEIFLFSIVLKTTGALRCRKNVELLRSCDGSSKIALMLSRG
jgi:hypothetical protein